MTCTCSGTCRSRQSSTSALRVGSDTDSGMGTATEPCTRSRPDTASRCRLARVQAWSGESASAPSVQATASTQRSPSSSVASATGPGPCADLVPASATVVKPPRSDSSAASCAQARTSSSVRAPSSGSHTRRKISDGSPNA